MRRPPTQKSLEQIEGVLGEPWVRLKDHRARGSRAPSLSTKRRRAVDSSPTCTSAGGAARISHFLAIRVSTVSESMARRRKASE